MAKMKGAIEINTERCNYVQQTNQDACTGCTSCAIVCPDGCITVYRKKVE